MVANKLRDSSFDHFLVPSLGDQNFEIFPLAGDASARKYFRVVHDNVSWVLMKWEPFVDDGKYPFLSVLRHFKKNGVKVPEVKALDEKAGLVLLEDLGDLTLERKFWEQRDTSLVEPFYQATLDELIKIHVAATNDNSVGPSDNKCVAFGVAFDHEKLMWEMNYAKKHLIKTFCDIKLTDKMEKQLDSELSNLCTTLSNQPRYICHRDYHSRNVMIKLGQTRVIDFQDARMGPVQYDLVSLIKDSYVDIDSELSDRLLKYYSDQMANAGRKTPLNDEFFDIYERQSVQRCFKACGSFSSFYNDRQDTRYLKYIKKTIKRVAESLRATNDYKTLLDIIDSNGLTERSFEST